MKFTGYILFFSLLLFCTSSCSLRKQQTGTDINNGIDAILLQQNLEQIDKFADETTEQLETIKAKSTEIKEVIAKEPASEINMYISDRANGIFSATETATVNMSQLKATSKNSTKKARNIEFRTRPAIDWAYMSRWAGWIILTVILGYLGLLPLVISILKRILKAIVTTVLQIVDELDGDYDIINKITQGKPKND